MAMQKNDEAQREAAPKTGASKREQRKKNNVRKIRLERMMSKAELARRAAVSTLTIDRIERGMPCRMDTKRKILEALGLSPSDREMVFGPDDRAPDERDERDEQNAAADPAGAPKTEEPSQGRDDD